MRIEEWSDGFSAFLSVVAIITVFVGVVMLIIGCAEICGIGEDKCEEERVPMCIHVFSYQGHEYFYNSHGGITHTESCRCRESEAAE